MSVVIVGILVYVVVMVNVVVHLFGITLKSKLVLSFLVVIIVCFSGQVQGQSLDVRGRFLRGFRNATKAFPRRRPRAKRASARGGRRLSGGWGIVRCSDCRMGIPR